MMAKYACVDIGGTFTDAAILADNGEILVFKSPTTPENWNDGIIGALETAAGYFCMPLEQLLKEVSINEGGYLTVGSTIATNAILEKKVGKIGIICTKGFREVFLFREGPSKDPYNPKVDFPEPFVPRYLTLPIAERIDAEGGIVEPLDEEMVRAAAKQLYEYNVEAIAVCFLWSIVNEQHERRAKEIINEMYPDLPVLLSCETNPQVNEYRRWVAVAMDASLKKLVSTSFQNLNKQLNNSGLIGEVLMLNSYGGVMSTKEISQQPLYSIDSGPAVAPVAGKTFSEQELDESNVVILDMGGTTFDVSCVINGKIGTSKDELIGDETPGINRASVHSVGAGGGSIAWVDNGGMIHVGPQSAGSVPGPACYDRGGTAATVTDANVVLGYLNPKYFNDGKMQLDVQKAYDAIKKDVADPLGIDVYEAAYTIWVTVNTNMISAIKDVTVWQGVDPREYTVVAGGGACGTQAIALADGLEMKKLLIPKMAGGLSAVGGLFTNKVTEFMAAHYTETRNFDYKAITEVVQDLYRKAEKFFEDNNISLENRKVELYMDGRYPSQVWDLSVQLEENIDENYVFDEKAWKHVEEAFHQEHERKFSVRDSLHVQCSAWRVMAIGKTERQAVFSIKNLAKDPKIKPKGHRRAYFRGKNAMIETPVYRGDDLEYGHVIKGPAIIEEPTTTIVVLEGFQVAVTKHGNYYIELNNH